VIFQAFRCQVVDFFTHSHSSNVLSEPITEPIVSLSCEKTQPALCLKGSTYVMSLKNKNKRDRPPGAI
jgi:hypothetical protein